MKAIIAFAAIALALMSTGFMTTSTIRAQGNATASTTQQQQIPFLPTTIFQDDKQIVTTITKSGEAPTGPIVVIPSPEGGKNGTILTPGENKTAENGNVTIIQPNGNVTEVPGGNVTVIDNNTVVVAPPDRNVTTTPGNVTIIDPPTPTPVKNETGNNNNQTCTCQQNQSGSGSIPPVQVIPAPGQNVTVNGGNNNNNGSGNQTNVTPNVPKNGTIPSGGPNNTAIQTPPLVPNNGNNGTNTNGTANNNNNNGNNNGTAGTTNLTVPTSLFPTISKVAINSNNKIIGN